MHEQIKQLWSVEQEILDVVHEVCQKHGLRYSLAYGTLIGAVRHKGFIPWDDDIDLVMPREDYERFLEVWKESAPEGYVLQNGRTDADFTQNFTKIRKDHTAFVQSETEKNVKYHKGVFVDIFPGDRVAQGSVARKIQYVLFAVSLLYSRGFASGSGGVIGLTEKILLLVPRKLHQPIRNWAEKTAQMWNKNENANFVFPSTIVDAGLHYPADMFSGLKTIDFGGKDYSCVADYDRILRVNYGDYMQLPPEEERTWKHHPLVLDFEHNYEELI